MSDPLMTRKEQRAFVLALLDVPHRLWWWRVIRALFPLPVMHLLEGASEHDDGSARQRECIRAAADLLRPRWTPEDVRGAVRDAATADSVEEYMWAEDQLFRMITGEETEVDRGNT